MCVKERIQKLFLKGILFFLGIIFIFFHQCPRFLFSSLIYVCVCWELSTTNHLLSFELKISVSVFIFIIPDIHAMNKSCMSMCVYKKNSSFDKLNSQQQQNRSNEWMWWFEIVILTITKTTWIKKSGKDREKIQFLILMTESYK